MKTYICTILLFVSIQVFSQEVFYPESKAEITEQAINLTEEYNKALALDIEQILLFQEKVEEFLVRRNKIDQEFSGKARLYMLIKLRDEENAEMHTILTHPQLEVYKKIHPLIQPINIVTGE